MDKSNTSKKETKSVVVRDNSVNDLISQAVAGGANVETLERIFTLREKVKAEQAEEEFVKAMTQFQSDCPVIKKTKKVLNKDGRTVRYTYAPLDSVVEQIKGSLRANELSYHWDTKMADGEVTATCFVTHSLGHTKSSSFTAAIDKNEYMSSPQRSASSVTFAKRQALLNALGIATGDEDTDAVDARKEKDAKSPKTKIALRLRALGESYEPKEKAEEAVKRLTGLKLEEKNFEEIATRLQVLVKEREDEAPSKKK